MSSSEAQSGLSECCLSGKLQTGSPKGVLKQIHGRETYVTTTEDGSQEKTILFLTDIFGHKLPNSQLLADEIAKTGFNVVIPNFFEGEALPIELFKHIEPPLKDVPNLTITDKLQNTTVQTTQMMPFAIANREAVAKPKIDAFVEALRQDPTIKKIGAVGFCWGGRHAVLLAQEGSKVDAVVACHPSMCTLADFEPVTKPISLAFGDKDTLVPMKQVDEIISLLEKKTELVKEIQIYEDQIHGFALRGDFSSEKDKKAMDECTQQIIGFFKQYL